MPIRLHPAPVSRTQVVVFPLHLILMAGFTPSYPSRKGVNHPLLSGAVSSFAGEALSCVGRCPMPVVDSTMPAAPVRVDQWLLRRLMFVTVSVAVVVRRILSAGQASLVLTLVPVFLDV